MYNGINSFGKHEYEYVRTPLSPGWDCPTHPSRLDGGGNQIQLGREIEDALPGVGFCLHAFNTKLLIWFGSALSAANETTLTNVINDHKNNA